MTGLVSDYSLVNFLPLTVKSKEMMLAIKEAIDKANGYCFTSVEEANSQRVMAFSNSRYEYDKIHEVRENFMGVNSSGSQSNSDDEPDVNVPKIKKSKQCKHEKLGNDLDEVDIDAPGFQI